MDRSARHGPVRLHRYLEIHETVLGHLEYRGLLVEESLGFDFGAHRQILMRGELVLRERVLHLQVVKGLEMLDEEHDPHVQTAFYSYNVHLPGRGNVFRYDSPHDGADDNHRHHQQHHRHQYDPFSADPKLYTVTLVEGGDWPLLAEVIEEADEWYWANRVRLLA